MNKSSVQWIDIPSNFRKIHNAKPFTYVAINSIVVMFTGVIAYYIATWWAYVGAFILVSIAGDALLKLQHEAMHGILNSNKKLNATLGKFISSLMGTRFYDAVTIHMRHHSRIGTNEDPNLYWYDIKKNIFIFMVGQLLGAKLWMFFSRTMIVIAGSIIPLHRGKLKTNTSLDVSPVVINRSRSINDLLMLGTIQLLLLTMISIFSSPWIYIVFIILPASTLGSFLESVRSFSEHVSFEQGNNGESNRMYFVSSNFFERIILSQFGFHYHHLHHFYPTVPVFNLRLFHRWLVQNQPSYSNMYIARKSYFGTLFKYIFKIPSER